MVLSSSGETTSHISSHVEKQLRRAGENSNGPFEAQHVPADDSRQRELTGDLTHYYDSIVAALHDAGDILILGPGEAKGELKKRFDAHSHDHSHANAHAHNHDSRTICVESADKLTAPQIAAHVRHHFHADALRRGLLLESVTKHNSTP